MSNTAPNQKPQSEMSCTVEQLVSVNPYNPDILPDLENYVNEQVSCYTSFCFCLFSNIPFYLINLLLFIYWGVCACKMFSCLFDSLVLAEFIIWWTSFGFAYLIILLQVSSQNYSLNANLCLLRLYQVLLSSICHLISLFAVIPFLFASVAVILT